MNNNGREEDKHQLPAAIDWNVPTRGTHELYPVSFSPRDVDVSYSLPFFVGLIKNAITTFSKRKPTIFLIDKAAVKKKKLEMRDKLNCTTISSNDVVSIALFHAADSIDVFVFTENARDGVTVPLNAGGNFLWEIPISKQAVVENPTHFRNAVQRRAFYPTNHVPAQAFWYGRVGRLTSLSTIKTTDQLIVFDGIETVCTMFLTSFLKDIPMDVALIFRYDKQYLGVLHNFVELKASELLDAIIVKD
jgi:hypothetical protein